MYFVLHFLSPSSFIPPQNVVYFLMLPFLVHKIFTFYINGVLKHTIDIIKYLKVVQHVSGNRGTSSGSLVQCLAKNYKNDSIVSVDTVQGSLMMDPL